jgi:hypothetical protein
MKTLTTTEKINQIRSNDKVNGIIDQITDLLYKLKEYTETCDDDIDSKIDILQDAINEKSIRNSNESRKLSIEIIKAL